MAICLPSHGDAEDGPHTLLYISGFHSLLPAASLLALLQLSFYMARSLLCRFGRLQLIYCLFYKGTPRGTSRQLHE
jgi:hypothetical protein